MVCKACKERGQTWNGSPPKCAFNSGAFSKDNWNCATAGLIRDIVYEGEQHARADYRWCEDQKYATVMVDEIEGADGALALWITWYKSRGATDGMWLLFNDRAPRPPTEAECVAIAAALQPNPVVSGGR